MIHLRKYALCFALVGLLASCAEQEKAKTITVKNSLDTDRSFETIELTKDFLKVEDLSNIGIRNIDTKALMVTQAIDQDGDGSLDFIIFQPEIKAKSQQTYEIVTITDAERPEAPELCYSRIVPERTDDYTWENDKVAFRVYGPNAQELFEAGDKNGTLSSGVDAWLKRVDYPIINKWYKKTTEGTGTYHEDTGEGLDNFHVGVSRGVGGIAVKVDTAYYISKNYTKWRTITTGPLRTSFYLEYENWDAAGKTITESKIVSLDLGQNFSKFDTSIAGTDEISAGLTLHEKQGEVSGNKENGWVSYWEPIADTEIGIAIVAPKKYFIDFETYDTEVKDLSNAYAHLKVIDNQVVYYSGFAWKKSDQFPTKELWEAHLNSFSQKLDSPLTVTFD